MTRPPRGGLTRWRRALAHWIAGDAVSLDVQTTNAGAPTRPVAEPATLQARLDETAAQVRALTDSLPDSYLYRFRLGTDERPHFLYLSEGVRRLHGLDPAVVLADAEQLLGQVLPEWTETLRQVTATSRAALSDFNVELPIRRSDGAVRWLNLRSRPRHESSGLVVWDGIATDITARRDADRLLRTLQQRAEALLALPHAWEGRSEKAFLRHALDVTEDLTDSLIGFVHFINADEASIELLTWSTRTLERYCEATHDSHYPVGEAGVWADALRQRRPVVMNDYASLPHRRGLPEGHSHVIRLISVPVMHAGKVVMVVGVGNKPTDYTDTDTETVQLMANEMWRIAQHQRAQQALRASEAYYRSVMRAAPVGLAMGRERCHLDVNEAYVQLTGYPREELLGHSARMLYPSDDEYQRVGRELYPQLERAGVGHLTTQFRRKDGELRDIQLSAAWLHPEQADGEIALGFLDVTERERALRLVRMLSLAVEQSQEAILITDLEGRIDYVNEAFLAVSGYRRDDVLGRNPRFLSSGKTPPAVYAELWQQIVAGGSWRGEFINRRQDGTEYTAFAIIGPIRGEDGQITHFVAVEEDITERKRMGQELDAYRYRLEDMVRQRTEELETARAAAEAANQAKSVFLANMSHEIRTPMNAILGLTYLMREDGPQPLQAERLGKIEHSAQHLLAIINDILDLSKIESGRFRLEARNFSLSGLLAAVRELIAQPAMDKGLSLSVTVSGVPEWLCGDETRLRQALLNYASNAVKFTEQGRVDIRALLDGGEGGRLQVRFEVEDTGMGIDESRQQRLFQAFEQADASITRRHGGTGLGLAITRHIAELMGGAAGVRSCAGQGSCFWFTVWLEHGQAVSADTAAGPVLDAAERLRTAHAGARVMLAEDNPINQEVASELLRRAGLQVTLAADGAEALRLAGDSAPDLVLMDVQMPGMDGLEATRRLRRLPGWAERPIIAMTANAFNDSRQACLDAGMNDFVAKPVDPDALFSTLLRWLRPDQVPAPLPAPPPAELDPAEAESTPMAPATGAAPAETASRQQPQTAVPADASSDAVDWRRSLGMAGIDIGCPAIAHAPDASWYLGLLRRLLHEHSADVPRLRAYLAQGQTAVAQRVTHTLKGAAGTLGARPIAEPAQQLDRLLKAATPHDSRELAEWLEGLEEGFARLFQLNGRLDATATAEQAAAAPASVSAASREALVAEMQTLLATADTRARHLLSAHRDSFRQILGQDLARFTAHLENYELDEASSLLPPPLPPSAIS